MNKLFVAVVLFILSAFFTSAEAKSNAWDNNLDYRIIEDEDDILLFSGRSSRSYYTVEQQNGRSIKVLGDVNDRQKRVWEIIHTMDSYKDSRVYSKK